MLKLIFIVVFLENATIEYSLESVCLCVFSPFTTVQTVMSYNSTLVQARNNILRMYVHLILKIKIYKNRHT